MIMCGAFEVSELCQPLEELLKKMRRAAECRSAIDRSSTFRG